MLSPYNQRCNEDRGVSALTQAATASAWKESPYLKKNPKEIICFSWMNFVRMWLQMDVTDGDGYGGMLKMEMDMGFLMNIKKILRYISQQISYCQGADFTFWIWRCWVQGAEESRWIWRQPVQGAQGSRWVSRENKCASRNLMMKKMARTKNEKNERNVTTSTTTTTTHE